MKLSILGCACAGGVKLVDENGIKVAFVYNVSCPDETLKLAKRLCASNLLLKACKEALRALELDSLSNEIFSREELTEDQREDVFLAEQEMAIDLLKLAIREAEN